MNLIDDIAEDAADVDCSLTFFKIDCGLFLHHWLRVGGDMLRFKYVTHLNRAIFRALPGPLGAVFEFSR